LCLLVFLFVQPILYSKSVNFFNVCLAVILLDAVIFCLMHIAVLAGVLIGHANEKRIKMLMRGAKPPQQILASIIIAARNEEADLPLLLSSLASQTYPNIEIIFLDDDSDDATPRLLAEFAALRLPNIRRVKVVRLPPSRAQNRKQAALNVGIREAQGGYLLFTDADCALGPKWVETHAAFFDAAPELGLVLGPVYKTDFRSPAPPEAESEAKLAHTWLYDYQCYDHAARYMYIASAAGLGAASGAFGNNIALRRAALDEIGGYETVPVTLTEDTALIVEIRKRSHYKIAAVWDSEARVFTRTETSWKRFVNQTLRWHRGGFFSRDIVTRAPFAFLGFTAMFCVASYFIAPFIPIFAIVILTHLINLCYCNIPTRLYSKGATSISKSRWTIFALGIVTFFGYLSALCLAGKKPEWKR
jgi:cellulose synthase/poly-beta-1,6-N-acetylglucosamine synthase-like glycosyltransferase